ncbi:hypothetical protein ACOSQ3_010524 [Xanthoceras sorbifolium]
MLLLCCKKQGSLDATVDTPVEPNQKLGEASNSAIVDKGSYQRLVGKLIYLSHTRPDIIYAVSMVSQFMHNSKDVYLQAVYSILQYLKATPEKRIVLKKGRSLTLEAYMNADYAGFVVDRMSTSGYRTFVGGNLVTWRSKKQGVVVRSSIKVEFRAMTLGIFELL